MSLILNKKYNNNNNKNNTYKRAVKFASDLLPIKTLQCKCKSVSNDLFFEAMGVIKFD